MSPESHRAPVSGDGPSDRETTAGSLPPIRRALTKTTGISAFTRSLTALFVFVAGCQSPSSIETGGETHFLKSCSPEDNTCGESLTCVCGVCTVMCDDEAACAKFPGATCVTAGDRCGREMEGRCDVECRRDADCSTVSPFHVCDDGICRTESPPPAPVETDVETSNTASSPGTSTVESTSSVTLPDAAGSSECTRGEVTPNAVLIIGDSFFAQTHQITAYLEDLARASGTLTDGERYRDGSRVVANTLVNDGIAQQYLTALADSDVRVVIMNGGGADALLATCEVIDESCTPLMDAVLAAESLLATMAQNAVADVIYAFYPEALDDVATARVDFLRPLIEARCADAPLACHWLDLRTTFEGNYETYLDPTGIFPSTAGSEATARAIWDVMQTQCIAQ